MQHADRSPPSGRVVGIEYHGVELNLSSSDTEVVDYALEVVAADAHPPWPEPDVDVVAYWTL